MGCWRPDIAEILGPHNPELLEPAPTTSPLGISYAVMARLPPTAERNRGEEPAALTDPEPLLCLCTRSPAGEPRCLVAG